MIEFESVIVVLHDAKAAPKAPAELLATVRP
ncbi:unnamed protein product, partial [Rotaria magnacalcarata]